MRFIEDSGSSFAREQRVEIDTEKKPNLFIWAVIIIVLLGLNLGSWAFCNFVFGHPEHPFSYKTLTKLDKLKPLRGYTATTAPYGKFRSPKYLFEQVYGFTKSELRAYNGKLQRHYLWNYSERQPVTFIYGDFTVEQSRPLTEDDLFGKGIVVRAEAYRFPDAKIELILPTVDPVSPDVTYFEPGMTLNVDKRTMAAAVLQASQSAEEEPFVFRAVPLITKQSGGADLRFTTPTGETLVLRTPERLNIVREDKKKPKEDSVVVEEELAEEKATDS